MMRVVLLSGCVAALLCAGGSDRPVSASVVAMTVGDLVDGADCCVRGVITDAQTVWSPDGQMLQTIYTLQLVECLMGTASGQLHVKVPGGTRDGVTIRNSEAPAFGLGEDVVLFGDDGGDGLVTPTGWFQGKFTLLDGKVRELNDRSWDAFRSEIQGLVALK